MATVSVEIGLTLTLEGRMEGANKFEFIRPSVRIADIEVDGDVSVADQLKLARKAVKPVWDLVEEAVEKLTDKAMKGD